MASPWASVNDIIMVLRRYTLAPKKAKRPSHLESFNYSRLRIYVNETGVKTDEQSDNRFSNISNSAKRGGVSRALAGEKYISNLFRDAMGGLTPLER